MNQSLHSAQVARRWAVTRKTALTGLLWSSIAVSAFGQPLFTITDLGALPGATGTYAFGLNDNGDVAGSSGANSILTGYIWSAGVMKSIGWLGNPGSGLFAVNGLG